MPFFETEIPGILVFEPTVLEDNRGYFYESFNVKSFQQQGLTNPVVQDNQSLSRYGVIRGLHYQLAPHAQMKLVRVVQGNILDVAVDIREGSPTFGKSYSLELSAENKKQLYIPAGFAHGFSVLSESAIVLYKCDSFYNKESEAGIRFDDPALGIDWGIPLDKVIVSDKDKELPLFADCRNNFIYNG